MTATKLVTVVFVFLSYKHCSGTNRGYYHFIRPHESLAVSVPGLRKPRQRSPAMTANLTNKLWSVEDVLKLPLAPALS